MTVFVGPSIWRQIDVRTATAMMVAMSSAPTAERVIWAPLWNDALIGRSRSIMCTEFLATDADVMIIIDDDIVFEPTDFWKIVEGARDTRGIYGGAYVTRSTEPHLSSRAWPGTNLTFGATPERRPIEFQYLATGFFAIHRDVIAGMIDADFQDAYGGHKIELCTLGADRPFYPFFQPFVCREVDGRLNYLSEDWAFCNRARQLGVGVWVDQSIMLQHMGWYPFTVLDIKTQRNPDDPILPSTGIDRATIDTAPPDYGNPVYDQLIRDIAAYTEDDYGTIWRMLQNDAGSKGLANAWHAHEESEAEWYKREDVGLNYILDLASWHLRGGGVPAALLPLLQGKRVLDYGCGIGTFALAAARAGANVTAYETNPVMRDFIRFRAQRLGIELDVVDEVPVEAHAFDVVSCWHVFEHLTDPEGTLIMLRKLLTPTGQLISDSGFDDQNTPMHHEHEDWDGVLAKWGFVRTWHRGLFDLQREVPRIPKEVVAFS